ncbi:MAG TPA: hypothetical protein VFE56_02340 [Candidatus Binataceae bacterium]|jgi:hypothetical protein|nr:hypothetical protein [Candidatus Binataceae bacterium]
MPIGIAPGTDSAGAIFSPTHHQQSRQRGLAALAIGLANGAELGTD